MKLGYNTLVLNTYGAGRLYALNGRPKGYKPKNKHS